MTVSIRIARPTDAAAIANIYNEAIRSTTATFDTESKSEDERLRWLESHDERHPVLVAALDGQVVGWAALTKWSDRPAYDQTAESSFYVGEQFRGRGVGRAMKERLVEEARRLGYHSILARVAEESDASIRINESFGFRRIGTMKEVGLKFGRRLDVHLMQLMLKESTACNAVDSSDATSGRVDGTVIASSEDIALQEFLSATDVIDWQDDRILSLATQLSQHSDDVLTLARATFEWVRDNVEHCVDFNRSEVTCRASEVFAARTGFCYAKSHLVAALMRANKIPTGFCYQRLSVNGDGPPYCLHGLNAVFLKEHGWYRIDARGNTDSIRAEFSPPHERLAFTVTEVGEADLPEIWPAPLSVVLVALDAAKSVKELQDNLPDIPVVKVQGIRQS